MISGAHSVLQNGVVWFLPKWFLFQFSWLQSKISPLFFQCPDSACKQDLLAYLQRIALYCHQLNICSKVKAEVQNLGGELVVSGVCMNYDVSSSCVFSSRDNNYSKLSFYAKHYRIQTRDFGAFSRSFNVCKVYNTTCATLLFLEETLYCLKRGKIQTSLFLTQQCL